MDHTRGLRRSASSLQIGDGGMDAQQFRDGGRVTPAEAAFGRDREPGGVATGRREAPPGALDTVGMVDEPEAELGLRLQTQRPQRQEVGA